MKFSYEDVNTEHIEEFVPYDQKKYTVGDFFKIGKEVYKVVDDSASLHYVVAGISKLCQACDFYDTPNCSRFSCDDKNAVLVDTLEGE